MHFARATQIVDVTTGVETTASPTTVGKDADVTAPATTVATGHGVTRAPSRAVLHVMMIVTTDVVDAIKAVDITKIAGATTIVDATKAVDVTAAGIAAVNATPPPWMRTVTNLDPAHGTGMIAPRRDLKRAPAAPGSPAGVETSMQLTSAMTAIATLPTSVTCSA